MPDNRPDRQPQYIVASAPSNGLGTASVVLAVVSLLLCWIPIAGWIGLPIAIVAVILGLLACFSGRDGFGMGIAGLVISTIPMGVFVISGMAWYAIISAAGIAAEEMKRAEAQEQARRLLQEQQQPVRPAEVQPVDRPDPMEEMPEEPAPAEKPAVAEEAAIPPEANESPQVEALPEAAAAPKTEPGTPFYVRAVLTPGKHSEPEVIELANKILRTMSQPDGVVDFFATSGPLKWSGIMQVSRSAKPLWLCRVTVTATGAKLERQRADALRAF